MGPLGKPPANLAAYRQELAAVQAVTMHSSNSNTGMKQYECGHTQPLM